MGLGNPSQIILYLLGALVASNLLLECSSQSTQVQIAQGWLQGKPLRSREGKEFVGFMGIPFARNPERFQPAKLPPPSWDGIRDATDYKPKCIQLNLTNQEVEGEEDCLFINVFTPKISGNYSVMAFIHGGGFQFGKAAENGPEFILDHDVVFVTFSYRLAALGFLSTGDSVLPGNLGLKDQNLALKWIQNNIHYFGGDRSRVTLFGESAGGASVSFHIISPLSQGLFRHAICQSGTALDRWTIVENPNVAAIRFANKLNCPTSTSQEMIECLKTKSAKDLINVRIQTSQLDSLIMIGPVVETEDSYENPAFLLDEPRTLYDQGKFAHIPLLLTVNDVEGLIISALPSLASPEVVDAFNNDWVNTAAKAFLFDKVYYKQSAKTWAARRLRKFYFGTRPVGQDTLMNFVNIYSDSQFIHRSRKTALTHAKYAPVYASVLSFKGIWSQAFGYGFRDILGMTHADDLPYLFTDSRYPPFPAGSESEGFSKLLVKLWVNFANSGNPDFQINGRKWLPINTAEIRTHAINWLYLKNYPQVFKNEELRERMQVWDQVDEVLETGVIPGKDEL
ncbi:unnamed protein product [Orchesella dallaii]|uniref:Carboxylic ester hydrolase n=1 Tax=Orchesella dallaii TaxID=48710 RepID=A0ABP1QMR7_9HEXA